MKELLRSASHACLALTLVSCALAAGQPAVAPSAASGVKWASDTEPAWTELQRALTGRWKATTPQNRTIVVSYRVVSNGSALVETFTSASGKETISVYHRDGGGLMLTHYCAQGNQARLKAIEATRGRIVFAYLDATNVGGEQDVMTRLALVLRADGFDQETVYRAPGGEQETTTLRFFSADDPPLIPVR